jgi:tRNA dimethylallyltransferase
MIRHHLLDICEPDQTVTLGQYQRLTYATIDQILDRDRLPIMVGGTGQYIMAVVEGWGIPKVPPHPILREKLGQLGENELNRWLRMLDANAADKIDSRNIRRVVRALEVTLITGTPFSELQRKTPPAYDICIIGLNINRELLYERIDRRVENMMADGLLEEVISLKEAGFDRSLPSMSGLGYRQIIAYLEKEITLEKAVERTKFETHRFARQQKTWFRQDDPRIHWFDPGENDTKEAVHKLARRWLEGLEV